MARGKAWAATLAGVVLSAVFLWVALRDVARGDLLASLEAARWWTVAPFLLSLFAYYWIKTVRWAALLRPVVDTRAGVLFVPVMVGYAAGAILPMQLGEVVRAWVGARRLGLRMATSLMSIALERVFDIVTILVLVAAAIAMFADASDWFAAASLFLAGIALAALAVLVLLVFRTEECLALARRALRFLPPAMSQSAVGHLRAGVGGLGALRRLDLLASVLGTSLLQWAFMYACIWLTLYAMNLDVSPLAAVLAMILTVIGTSLPNSPGYVGSIQLAFTLGLSPFGVEPAQAVAASLFFHLLAYLSVVITGLALLPAAGLSPGEVAGVARGTPGGPVRPP
jgi:hypothetical protein